MVIPSFQEAHSGSTSGGFLKIFFIYFLKVLCVICQDVSQAFEVSYRTSGLMTFVRIKYNVYIWTLLGNDGLQLE